MNKYLLRFTKKNNMRFISHLDLDRLFKRAIRKSDIDVDFSSGFNPHEKINIVHPLSLGFESDSEYFEIATKRPYEVANLINLLNSAMPDGISFFEGKQISEQTYSNLSDASLYAAKIKISKENYKKIDLNKYLSQDQIVVKKRDKKTKTYVDKNVKSFVYKIEDDGYENGELSLLLTLRTATNETLNPLNLVIALLSHFDIDFCNEDIRINRIDILAKTENDFISLFVK